MFLTKPFIEFSSWLCKRS